MIRTSPHDLEDRRAFHHTRGTKVTERTRTASYLVHSQAPRPLRDRSQRKAWDLNPHGGYAARFSKPARPTVFGYLPFKWSAGESNPDFLGANQASSRWTSVPSFSVVWRGFEPLTYRLPGMSLSQLSYHPVANKAQVGIEPTSPAYQAGALPLSYQAVGDMGVEPNVSSL